MAMQYDPNIIVEFASRLYSKANSIVATYTFFGLMVGAFAGMAWGGTTGAIVGAIVIGVIGYSMGTEKAFQLRLQAQTALCQVQIELNTRPLGA